MYDEQTWELFPLSMRIAERSNATDKQKQQTKKETDKMMSELAKNGDAKNPRVFKTKATTVMNDDMILAWEYLTRILNPKRKW